MSELQEFIDSWQEDSLGMKPVFESFLQDLDSLTEARIEFNARPGISYSLRGIHDNQKERPLFVMIDVIDDDPKSRWLSVCFYGDMIQDPEELGDLIPEGLLGDDGYCFDVDESDAQLTSYVRQRVQEAYQHACENGS